MAGYAKLFHSIVHSTIWREEDHIRLVWITMLAIADKNGFVEASIPGLADVSRVTLDECKEALDRLASPDEFSRSQDYEGRRIESMDGGWLLLNYTKYRGAIMEEKIREQNRIRQQRFRDSKKTDRNAKVTGNAKITPVNACNAQSDPDPDPNKNKDLYSANPRFCAFWKAYPKKKNKGKALAAWKNAKKNGLPDIEIILKAIEEQKKTKQWQDYQYIPYPERWINGGAWDDETENPEDDEWSGGWGD